MQSNGRDDTQRPNAFLANKAETPPRCLICGNTVRQNAKGRPREFHGSHEGEPKCNQVWNLLTKLEAALTANVFDAMTQESRKSWRARCWAMANYVNR